MTYYMIFFCLCSSVTVTELYDIGSAKFSLIITEVSDIQR